MAPTATDERSPQSSEAAPSTSPFGPAVEAELVDVEQRFSAELHSDLACVNELVAYVERFRGKMLRPALVIASGQAMDDSPIGEPHRVIAAVLEMVHMATLVHDDVLDEASMRRRGATINRLQGNEPAVMLGDYLISHAYHLCNALDDQQISRTVAKATNTTCEGELLQLANRGNWQLNRRTYFEIVRRKTGCLCATACGLGASLAGANRDQAEAMSAFGEAMGMAFQVADDVLDLQGDPATVGKTLGLDLRKGKLTLPMILWLEMLEGRDRDQAIALLDRAAMPDLHDRQRDDALAQIRENVARCGALDKALRQAEEMVTDRVPPMLGAGVPAKGAEALDKLGKHAIWRSR